MYLLGMLFGAYIDLLRFWHREAYSWKNRERIKWWGTTSVAVIVILWIWWMFK